MRKLFTANISADITDQQRENDLSRERQGQKLQTVGEGDGEINRITDEPLPRKSRPSGHQVGVASSENQRTLSDSL